MLTVMLTVDEDAGGGADVVGEKEKRKKTAWVTTASKGAAVRLPYASGQQVIPYSAISA